MQGRKKLTAAQQAKRDAKRTKREQAEPTTAPAAGPTLGTLIARDDLVRTALKSTRALIAAANEFAEASARQHLRVISCHTCTEPKGCCKLPMVLMFHEVLPVADRLRRDGRDTPELRARLAESAELMTSRTRSQYRELVRPCVFLDAAERCTVYEERPRECGTAFVFSPAADCSNLRVTEIETALPPMDAVKEKLLTTERFIGQSLGLARIDGRYVGALPRMVLLWLEAWDRTDFADYLAEQMEAPD